MIREKPDDTGLARPLHNAEQQLAHMLQVGAHQHFRRLGIAVADCLYESAVLARELCLMRRRDEFFQDPASSERSNSCDQDSGAASARVAAAIAA